MTLQEKNKQVGDELKTQKRSKQQHRK